MVEATQISSSVSQPQQKLKLSDFYDHDSHTVTGQNYEEENCELVSGELESLESILTSQEIQELAIETVLSPEDICS